jgi:hypothetical protein
MAATVLLTEFNTGSQTPTDKTSGTVRFKNADNATVDAVNRLVVPTGATSEFSYEKWLGLNVTAAPSTDIQNVGMYMDGANGFGTLVFLWARAAGAFTAPVEPSATTGFLDAFAYTAAGFLTMFTGTFAGTGILTGFAVLAMEVRQGAAQGTTPGETLTVSYDET